MMGAPKSHYLPTEVAPDDSDSSGVLVSLMLGMLLCLPGVLLAWALRTSDNHWKSGAAAAAWTGCLLSPIVWILLIVVGTVLFTLAALPSGELAKYVWPDQL
ncbi:hypothetical protein DCC26_10415 [Auritidibacter sp. NML120779]|nr:hypothetical protein DCC26_10415 [Auritidibacter sp. NML120779]